MKNSLILLSLFISSQLMADIIKIECSSEIVEGVHQFQARGLVVVDDFSNIDGSISLKTKKSNEDQSILIFEQVKVSGVLRHFEPGKISKEAFDQLILKFEDGYLKNMNASLNVKAPLISNVTSVDNFVYRSNCISLDDLTSN